MLRISSLLPAMLFTALFTALFNVLLSVHAFAAEPQVVAIKTVQGQMRYDVTDFTVRPGVEVKLTLDNTDDIPHNLVLFQAGTDVVAAANKNLEKPDEALKRDWLPADPRILANTKLVGPKTTGEVVFKAPANGGIYPYVCTFPGHALNMKGQMRVVMPGPGLTGLHFALYLGDWQKLPDFAALKPHREGEVADGLLQLKFDDYKNQYGVVFTGKLAAPKEGEYTFLMASDDGGRLTVDGKKVMEDDGIHPASVHEGKVRLAAGEHDVRVDYFQQAGQAELFLAWSGETFTMTPLSKWMPAGFDAGKPKQPDPTPSIPLVVGKEPVMYRNFIAGAGGRPMAIGYPGGFNIAWSVDGLNLALLWRGAFMDAGRHWTDRGGGEQGPLGYDVLRPVAEIAPPFAVLPSASSEWPAADSKGGKGKDDGSEKRAEGYEWKGYTLDAKRFPTLLYEWGGVKVSERYDVEGDATAAGRMVRTLKLAGKLPENAYLRIANGTIAAVPEGFSVDGGTFDVQGRAFENKFTVAADGALVAGRNLIVPARAEIKITYTWATSHAGHIQ